MTKAALLACLASLLVWTSAARADDLGDFCRDHPDRVRAVLDAINLNHPRLERVKSAAERNDLPAAAAALLDYYKNADTAAWLRKPTPPPSDRTHPLGEDLIRDVVKIKNKPGPIRRLESGKIDWVNAGPDDERQWQLILLRQHYLQGALAGYFETGKTAYAAKIDEIIADYAMANSAPKEASKGPPWGTCLEVAARARVWSQVFFNLQNSDALRPSTRLLILGGIPQHAEYLKLYHVRASNMAILQMWGLAEAGAAFPEFKGAANWTGYALNVAGKEARSQVYPDGAHKELTDMYHYLTIRGFESICESVERGGKKRPPEIDTVIARMWTFTAYTLSPDGQNQGGNDSDFSNLSGPVLQAAKSYKRPDWAFIASGGKEGSPPPERSDDDVVAHGSSSVFRWAGQVIMRNGFGADAHWSYFDAGPWGSNQATGGGHQHHDALHISVSAFGRPLLVDSGRFTYMTNVWWHYFTHGAGHNTILLDERGQNPRIPVAEKPLDPASYKLADAFDFALATFDDGFGDISGRQVPKGVRKPQTIAGTHTRAVLYLRDRCWVVVDRVTTDKPRLAQTLWHFHPDCSVVTQGADVVSTDAEKGNLRIVPAEGQEMKVEIIKGQETPRVQGWYGYEYGLKAPAATAVFSRRIDNAATFAWLLLPARGVVPEATLKVVESNERFVRVGVEVKGRPAVTATIPLVTGGSEVKVETAGK